MPFSLTLPEQFHTLALYVTTYISTDKLLLSVFILFIFWGFKNLFTHHLFHFLLTITCKNKKEQDSFFTVLHKPVKHIIVLTGGYLALQNLLPDTFALWLNSIFRTGIIILFANAVYSLIIYYTEHQSAIPWLFNSKMDKIAIPFLANVSKFIVLALAFVAIASTWKYDVNGFIAGLGLGGLAFALAAKDLLANIFSGIVIIIDKPFSIGDWIKTNEVEGTITDINFRSTKIRAFDQALVTVPNSNLVNAPIVNFTNRALRRITFHLKVRYDTPSHKVKACITQIEDLLRTHPCIDQNTIFVKFDSFSDNGLEIFLYFFTRTTVWGEYLSIKQDINFKIMEILEAEGVSFALPSTSVYLEKDSSLTPKATH